MTPHGFFRFLNLEFFAHKNRAITLSTLIPNPSPNIRRRELWFYLVRLEMLYPSPCGEKVARSAG
jgi:hypothetical protein